MKQPKIAISIVLLASLLLSACGAGKPEPTPTMSLEQIQTAAVVTFAAGLTQTAILKPPATLTPTPQPTNTLLPTLPISTQPTATTGGVLCNNLVYVADVTIPDNTVMTPGQTFTKTWRVQNSGSCAWGPGYKFSFVTGDAMGGQTVNITTTVNSGALYEISVPMTAPLTGSGTIKGEWRMADPNGVFFGAQIWVQITLGGAATISATSGPTSTATPTKPSTTGTP